MTLAGGTVAGLSGHTSFPGRSWHGRERNPWQIIAREAEPWGQQTMFLDHSVLVLVCLGQITVLCPPWLHAPSSVKCEQYLSSFSHWAGERGSKGIMNGNMFVHTEEF